MAVPLEGRELGARVQLDGRILLDAADEVARHRVGEVLAAHQQVHASGRLGEEHGRLAGRVAAADDDDRLAARELRFHEGRRVVDARAFESLQVGDRRAADNPRPWR